MAFVSQVAEAQATPEVKQLFQQIQQHYGFLPNYYQALGHLPHVIKGHQALSGAILKDGALSLALKEQIGLVVSGINASSYCINAHMQVLSRLGVEAALASQLVTDYANAPAGEKEQALFRFADKLTRTPDEIEQVDVEAVFQAGWDEGAFVEAVLAVAWFNFVNRVSLGLGLVADF
jgi:uncharacterized peroxidase-related enzyme